MYDDKKGQHYFIDEPTALSNGQLVVPVRWLEDEGGAVWADVWEIRRDKVSVKVLLLYPASRDS